MFSVADETAGHQKQKDDKMHIKLGQTYKYTNPMIPGTLIVRVTDIKSSYFTAVDADGSEYTFDMDALGFKAV